MTKLQNQTEKKKKTASAMIFFEVFNMLGNLNSGFGSDVLAKLLNTLIYTPFAAFPLPLLYGDLSFELNFNNIAIPKTFFLYI